MSAAADGRDARGAAAESGGGARRAAPDGSGASTPRTAAQGDGGDAPRAAADGGGGGAPRAALVEIVAARGSTPREAGAWMLVDDRGAEGTIGGGRLELQAIAAARALLREGGPVRDMEVALGPEIGQCCGGRVRLSLRPADPAAVAALRAAEAAARPEVWVFGAGHVGRALAAALAPLPVRAALVDARAAELAQAPPGVALHETPLPEALVRAAAPGAAFVVLTHDHGLDFLLAAEALARGDAAWVGMIGSATKRATFARWARARDVDPAPLVCPIGAPSADKRPAVIAALTAAEVMRALAG